MKREDAELMNAMGIVGYAEFLAAPALPEDRTAVMQAILCRALELATPDLSPVNRAALFFQPTRKIMNTLDDERTRQREKERDERRQKYPAPFEWVSRYP